MIQVVIALDQLVNALLGGWADETLSARAFRKRGDSYFWFKSYMVINAIFFLQQDHCGEAFANEQLRRHSPREYRETN